ncbi:MAG: hypothetical protein KDD11_18390 [Acidobacteria bacterium]|nr:hypothetical protein [Acidobacteriota bacterium]
MKTAISLPDELFQAAEREATRTQKSRSQLYADALIEYLAQHAPDSVEDTVNRVLDRLGTAETDPFAATAARRMLERSEW